jgi:hypothetical protein
LAPNGQDDLVVGSILSEFLEDELNNLATTDLPSASLFQDLQRLVVRANRIVRVIAHHQNNDAADTNITLKSLLQECLRMKVSYVLSWVIRVVTTRRSEMLFMYTSPTVRTSSQQIAAYWRGIAK